MLHTPVYQMHMKLHHMNTLIDIHTIHFLHCSHKQKNRTVWTSLNVFLSSTFVSVLYKSFCSWCLYVLALNWAYEIMNFRLFCHVFLVVWYIRTFLSPSLIFRLFKNAVWDQEDETINRKSSIKGRLTLLMDPWFGKGQWQIHDFLRVLSTKAEIEVICLGTGTLAGHSRLVPPMKGLSTHQDEISQASQA